MFEAIVNGGAPLSIDFKGDEAVVNGQPAGLDTIQVGERSFQVIQNGKTYSVHVVEVDRDSNTATLIVNGKRAVVEVSNELDRLLKRLGLENAASSKISEMKAPMPGLIHSLHVAEGESVEKGDQLLILEAMKMENVIKSPTDGVVKRIHVKQGQSVEKGQLMISFE